jgi:hypothetical protein
MAQQMARRGWIKDSDKMTPKIKINLQFIILEVKKNLINGLKNQQL